MVYSYAAPERGLVEAEAEDCIILEPEMNGGMPVLSLAHTNQQLRAEYRPFLLLRTQILVAVEHLDRFLKDFYPVDNVPEHVVAKYVGRLTIGIDAGASTTFDLLPLLRLIQRAPKLCAHFEVTYNNWDQRYADDLNTIIQCWPGVEPRDNKLVPKSKNAEDSILLPAAFRALTIRKLQVGVSWGWLDRDTIPVVPHTDEVSRPSLTFVFAREEYHDWMNGATLHGHPFANIDLRYIKIPTEVQKVWKPSLIWDMSGGHMEHHVVKSWKCCWDVSTSVEQ
jgi:hypothetical protein